MNNEELAKELVGNLISTVKPDLRDDLHVALDAAEERGREENPARGLISAWPFKDTEGSIIRETAINNCIAALEANGHPPHTSMAFPIGVLRNLLDDDTKEKSDG